MSVVSKEESKVDGSRVLFCDIIIIANTNTAFVGISCGGFNLAVQKFNGEPKVDTLRHRMIPVKNVIIIIKIRVNVME